MDQLYSSRYYNNHVYLGFWPVFYTTESYLQWWGMSLCLPVFWLLCVLEVQNLTTNPLLGEEDMPGNLTESLIVRVFRKAVKTACCENRWIINAESSTAFSHSPDGDVNSRRPQACWTYCYTTLKQALRPALSMPGITCRPLLIPFSRTKPQHSMPFRTHQNTFQVLWKYQLPDHKYLQGSNPSNQTRDQGFFPLKSPSNLPASVIYPWLYFVQGKCFWLSTLSLHHNFVHLHQVSLQSPLLQGDQPVQSSSELKFSLWEWSSSTKRMGI